MKAIGLMRDGASQAQAARQVGVSRQAVSKWWRAFEADPYRGIQARRATGRPLRVDRRALMRVLVTFFGRALADGLPAEVWTTGQLGGVLADCLGVRYSRVRVWKLLRSFGWNPKLRKAPASRDAGEQWLQTRWPKIKDKLKLY